jgi:transposase
LNLFGALLVSPKLRKIRLSVRSLLCNLRSEHTIVFLEQVLKLVPGDIVLVWDNHKIHISPQTQEFIDTHPRLHEYRFPTCAPELNPVEFVWTQVSEHTASLHRITSKNCVVGCRLASPVQELLKSDCWLA